MSAGALDYRHRSVVAKDPTGLWPDQNLTLDSVFAVPVVDTVVAVVAAAAAMQPRKPDWHVRPQETAGKGSAVDMLVDMEIEKGIELGRSRAYTAAAGKMEIVEKHCRQAAYSAGR